MFQRRAASLVIYLAVIALCATGCWRKQELTLDQPDGGDTDSGSDTDTDTDSDGDTDTDSDSDTDTGTGTDDSSNLGHSFLGVDLDNQIPEHPFGIAVVNPGPDEAHVWFKESSDSGWQILEEIEIPAGAYYAVTLGDTTIQGSYHQPHKAFLVESNAPVAAYQLNPYEGLGPLDQDICSNDGTALIPYESLGQHYIALTYPGINGHTTVAIAAAVDGTAVGVTPTADVESGTNVDDIPAGETVVFGMDAADVLQLRSQWDLSGTVIQSDQPVAVFGSSPCAAVPNEVMWCDHLEHQMFPLTAWGQEFVAARSPIRSIDPPAESDYWRIVASQDDTHIATDPPVAGLHDILISTGQVAEAGVDYSFAISADAPVMVGQFLTGQTATDVPFEEAGGDPAFALVTPVEQHRKVHTVLVPPNYVENQLVITHPIGTEPTLDGEPLGQVSSCEPGETLADFEVTRCTVSMGGHVVEADEPIAVNVWGYGSRVSYGYTAGFGLAAINSDD